MKGTKETNGGCRACLNGINGSFRAKFQIHIKSKEGYNAKKYVSNVPTFDLSHLYHESIFVPSFSQ